MEYKGSSPLNLKKESESFKPAPLQKETGAYLKINGPKISRYSLIRDSI
jgi:hypothetical protein